MTKGVTGLGGGLNYRGVEAPTPSNSVQNPRNPTTKDVASFNIGDYWMNSSTQALWYLGSKAMGIANWVPLSAGGGGDVIGLQPDVGAVVNPVAGIINVHNTDGNIVTSNGGANNLNENFAPSIVVANNITSTNGVLTVNNNTTSIVEVLHCSSNTNNAVTINMNKDRAGATVINGDSVGRIQMAGFDGTNYIPTAIIRSTVTGAVSPGVVPSDLEFFTSANSGTGVCPMILDQSGELTVQNNTSTNNGVAATLRYFGNDTSSVKLNFQKDRNGAAVHNGDAVARIQMFGFDGTNYIGVANIISNVTGAVSPGVVPGNLQFFTSPGSGPATPAMVINQVGGMSLTGTSDASVTFTCNGTMLSLPTYSTTIGVTNSPLAIDNTGLIGIAPSSIKYKENVEDLGDKSSKIMNLRPVSFNFKSAPLIPAWGLIAEEVAEIFPQLVGIGLDGQPESVKYHELAVLLLNEVQKLAARVAALETGSSPVVDKLSTVAPA